MKKKLPRQEVLEQQLAASEASEQELHEDELEDVSGSLRIPGLLPPIMMYGIPFFRGKLLPE